MKIDLAGPGTAMGFAAAVAAGGAAYSVAWQNWWATCVLIILGAVFAGVAVWIEKFYGGPVMMAKNIDNVESLSKLKERQVISLEHFERLKFCLLGNGDNSGVDDGVSGVPEVGRFKCWYVRTCKCIGRPFKRCVSLDKSGVRWGFMALLAAIYLFGASLSLSFYSNYMNDPSGARMESIRSWVWPGWMTKGWGEVWYRLSFVSLIVSGVLFVVSILFGIYFLLTQNVTEEARRDRRRERTLNRIDDYLAKVKQEENNQAG